jgi:hypothetical protein
MKYLICRKSKILVLVYASRQRALFLLRGRFQPGPFPASRAEPSMVEGATSIFRKNQWYVAASSREIKSTAGRPVVRDYFAFPAQAGPHSKISKGCEWRAATDDDEHYVYAIAL